MSGLWEYKHFLKGVKKLEIFGTPRYSLDGFVWNQWVNAKGNTTYSIYNDSINVSSWVDGTYYVNASVSDVG